MNLKNNSSQWSKLMARIKLLYYLKERTFNRVGVMGKLRVGHKLGEFLKNLQYYNHILGDMPLSMIKD